MMKYFDIFKSIVCIRLVKECEEFFIVDKNHHKTRYFRHVGMLVFVAVDNCRRYLFTNISQSTFISCNMIYGKQ